MFTSRHVVVATCFYPRGGSAHSIRALAGELERRGLDVTVLAGSYADRDGLGDARSFFSGLDLRPVDFTPALSAPDPMRHPGGPGTAPMQPSYEDRPGAADRVFASLGEEEFELQVEAWGRELELAGAATADVLYLHHLTPLNEAASRRFPAVPVIGHLHGSELLMLERIERQPDVWDHSGEWAARLRGWAKACARVVVSTPGGLERARRLFDLPAARFAVVPNGFDDRFAPASIDRRAHWHRHLVAAPRGWLPGAGPGSIRYGESDLEAFRGCVLLYAGRFTRVKSLPLLISAYARASERFARPSPLVLVGGYPGEWEDEHPAETIKRLGVSGVFLAGWHDHDALPDFFNASDVLVHPSAREQFGQVIVEAMACSVPPIAIASAGPLSIVDAGESGWLVPSHDEEELADAMVEAVNHPAERRQRGARAREAAHDRYTWSQAGGRLLALVEEVLSGDRGAGDPVLRA